MIAYNKLVTAPVFLKPFHPSLGFASHRAYQVTMAMSGSAGTYKPSCFLPASLQHCDFKEQNWIVLN